MCCLLGGSAVLVFLVVSSFFTRHLGVTEVIGVGGDINDLEVVWTKLVEYEVGSGTITLSRGGCKGR